MDRLNALRQRRLWWMGALTIALAIVGHDAMMAGNAQAAGHGHASVRGAELARRADDAHANPCNANAKFIDHRVHTSDCSAVHPGIRRNDGDAAIDRSGATGTRIAARTTALNPAVNAWWREPTAPPRVRRALFQIFRM